MSNLSILTAFTRTAAHLREDGSESSVESVAHLDEPSLAVAVEKGLASQAPYPLAELEAARVLASALIGILKGESESELKQEPKIRFRDEVERFEANLIMSALAHTGGRQRRAARLLGMNVSTLNLRIKRYRLNSKKEE